MKKIVLCDFDETIVKENVFCDIMREFNCSDWESVSALWLNREISTAESLAKQVSRLRCSLNELEAFLKRYKIPRDFFEWLEFCDKNRYVVYIVSEGLDFYIESILRNHNLQLEFYAHHLSFVNGRPVAACYGNQKDNMCGTLKKRIFDHLNTASCRLSVIGNDLADAEIANIAERVFAKNELSDYCDQHNIPHVKFMNFRDILECFGESGYE